MIKLFLKRTDEQNDNFKKKKICYSYDEKEHIINKCFKFKQENFQINIIENFQQSFHLNVGRTSSIHFITKIFDESKN